MKKRNLKAAILVDPGGSFAGSADKEVKDIKKEWSEILKPNAVRFYQVNSAYPGEFQPGTDLIFFDYGGVGYGNDLGERNSQYLTQYCIDNPNVLALVISTYTWNHYIKYIINDFGYTDIPNLKVVDWLRDEEIIPKWFLEGLNPPIPTKGNICQLCHNNLDETSRKDKSLEGCSGCNKQYCQYCRWEKGVKGIDLICVDCGDKYYDISKS